MEGLTAAARAKKKLTDSDLADVGMVWGWGVSCPLSSLLFLAAFSSCHPRLEGLLTF